MKTRKYWILGVIAMLLVLTAVAAGTYLYFRNKVNLAGMVGTGTVADVTLPPGFAINVFAGEFNNPRFIHFGPDGVLYVADRRNGRIVALPDNDRDGVADETIVFADDLDSPHSLIYHEGAWYVGVPTGVIRLQDTDDDGRSDQRETLIDDYPTSGHSTRTIEFLPDGRMVVSVGSSCNVCEEDDGRRAAIVAYDDGNATGETVFAKGLRNAVGLAIHPETGELWASNNGRDLMGDDIPPENIYIVDEGKDYGWPVCHSGRIIDPDMGSDNSCDGIEPPVIEMQAHSAPLGIAFYTGDSFPLAYRGDLFIAFHGSWNRSEPTGYKIVRLPFNGSQPTGELEDFATGWLNTTTGEVDGRPVGLAISPEGDLFVSDDKAGLIYRISYVGGR